MSSKLKYRKQKKARNLVVLVMILSCKGGIMKDRREQRGGTKNHHRDLLHDDYDDRDEKNE